MTRCHPLTAHARLIRPSSFWSSLLDAGQKACLSTRSLHLFDNADNRVLLQEMANFGVFI
jgi:hypothetical protein